MVLVAVILKLIIFIISESLLNKCDNVVSKHSYEDFSDHLPIMLNAIIEFDLIKGKTIKDEKISRLNLIMCRFQIGLTNLRVFTIIILYWP